MAKARTLVLNTKVNVTGADKLTGLSQKMTQVGKAATTFVTLPLLAAGAAAFKFSSDLEEATNKATTVFGDASAAMIKESENLNDAFSQAEFLDLSGTFGSLLKNMEFTTKEAAKMSSGFLDLAADMASFHNADPTEAIGAIRSALAGEFEPLKRFGVALNVAAIEAKALEMGLWDGTGAIDANTRALVVQSELIRQQPDLIGDWDRTLGGAANQQRLLTKNFQDAAAAIGQELLPVATQLITTVNGWIKAFKGLSPETRKLIVQVAGVLAVAGPLLIVVGKLVQLGAALGKAYRFLFVAKAVGELSRLGSAASTIGPAFTRAAAAARTFGSLLLGPLGIAVAAFTAGFATDFLGMRTRFEKDMGDIGDFLGDAGDAFRDFFGIVDKGGASGSFTGPLAEMANSAEEAAHDGVVRMASAFEKGTPAVVGSVSGMALAILEIMDIQKAKMRNLGFQQQVEYAKGLLDAQNNVKVAIEAALQVVQDEMTKQEEIAFLSGQRGTLMLARGIASAEGKTASVLAIDGALALLRQRLGDLGVEFYTSGKEIGISLGDGLTAAYGYVRTAAGKLAAAVRGQIGINSEPSDPSSPLRGLTKWGGNIATTLAADALRELGTLRRAGNAMAGAIVPSFGAMTPALAGGGFAAGMGGTTNIYNNFTFSGTPSGSKNELSSLLRDLSAVSGGDVRYG